MLRRKNRSITLLCLLKDSDPLQRSKIRLMALIEMEENTLSVQEGEGTEG